MDSLYPDIWNIILDFLDLDEIKYASLACKFLYRVCNDYMYKYYWWKKPSFTKIKAIHLETIYKIRQKAKKIIVVCDSDTFLIGKECTHLIAQSCPKEWKMQYLDYLEILDTQFDINIPIPVERLILPEYNVSIPEKVKSLVFFGCSPYCDSLKLENLPSHLKHLEFKHSQFDKSLDNLPSGLLSLKLPFDFNQSIKNLPSGLKVLKFDSGSLFNQPIDNLPSTIETLSLDRAFNQPVTRFPSHLKKLKMLLDSFSPDYFKVMPETLTKLHIMSIAPLMVPDLSERFPNLIDFRIFAKFLNKKIDFLPKHITRLDLSSDRIDIETIVWPQQLEKLTISGVEYLDDDNLPSTLKYLNVSFLSCEMTNFTQDIPEGIVEFVIEDDAIVDGYDFERNPIIFNLPSTLKILRLPELFQGKLIIPDGLTLLECCINHFEDMIISPLTRKNLVVKLLD